MDKRIIAIIILLILLIILIFPNKKDLGIIKYKSNHNIDSVVFIDINKDTFVIYKGRHTEIIKR
jgi:hypothetical protein